MNEKQVKWASQHDWFEGAWLNSLGQWVIVVMHRETTPDYIIENEYEFIDFDSLKQWAGY